MNNDLSTNTKLQYWAAIPDLGKFAGELNTRIDDYYKFCWNTGLCTKWRKSYLMYYINYINNAQIASGGDSGEFSLIKIAEASNIIQHLINLTIDDRPAWEPRASNSDVKSQKQTILARGLLDYYMREKNVAQDFVQAVQNGFIFGEGFVSQFWDATAGDLHSIDSDTGEPLNAGDLKFKSHEPIDIIRDIKLNSFRDRDWLIVREFENKYNLMAKFPKQAQEIDSVSSDFKEQQHYRWYYKFPYNTDQIAVYKFYHAKTAALPDGRYTMFVDNDSVLEDGKLPYEHIPVNRCSPRDIIGQSFGHAPMYDLIPINDNLNMLYSTILTNQEAFGVNNIMAPKGAGISYEQLASGLNFIEYNDGSEKPEVMQMLNTAPEIFKSVDMMTSTAARISGINDVTRGQAPSADMSGAGMALLEQSAIQYNQSAQWSYIQMLEDVGTTTIQTLKQYAKIERVITIAGKNNRSNTIAFKGDDISNIDRVLVDKANPMSKTVAGKLQIAQMLLQAKIIPTADEILQLINTGSLDPMTEGKTMELLGLKAENEELSEGRFVQVVLTDDHLLHITEHKSILADPAARQDANVVKTVAQHIQAHVAALTDPANAILLKLMGQPAVPPSAAPQPQGVTQQAASAPQQGQGVVQSAPQGGQEMVQNMQPNQPSGPVNPLTHQQVPLKTGGQ